MAKTMDRKLDALMDCLTVYQTDFLWVTRTERKMGELTEKNLAMMMDLK